jgi:hypothetical protein
MYGSLPAHALVCRLYHAYGGACQRGRRRLGFTNANPQPLSSISDTSPTHHACRRGRLQ